MFISIEKKCIYIGVPHTGSTSIHAYLSEKAGIKGNHVGKKWVVDVDSMKHASLSQIVDFLKPYGWNTDGWTVIYTKRNCVDSYLSEFFLMERVADQWKRGERKDIVSDANWQSKIRKWAEESYMSLDEWMVDSTRRWNSADEYDIEMLNIFIGLENTKGKYNIEEYTFDKSTYADFFKSVCRRMGLPEPEVVPWVNDSNRELSKMQIEEETIQILKIRGLM
jgi:hypothetical protein